MKIDGVMLADADANVAFLVFKIEARFRIDISNERNGLGKMDMNGLGQRQILIVRIGDLDRAVLDAGRATRAFVLDDVSGLPVQGDLEVSRFSFDADNLGVGQDIDIGMPAALDELRGFDAHRAVIGGKCLVELRHFPADGRRLVDQVDFEAGFGEVEGGLNAADPAADDQHIAERFAFCDV